MYPAAIPSGPLRALRCFIVLAILLCGMVKEGVGQGARIYATSQDNGGTIITSFHTNPAAAVDQNPLTHSTIGVTVVGNVWQRLQFTSNIQGKTVRVKIGTTGNILSLLGNISIQAYQNNTAVGSSVQISTLISLIAGEDQAEIVFTPSATSNSVRISSSGVALGGGLKIYEAYYLDESNTACSPPRDVLFGSTGNIAGGLNAVENAYNAIDGNNSTFSTIRANVSAAGNKTHLTALFDIPSQIGDSIRILLRRPGNLLEATLLSNNLWIRTMLDNTDNGNLALDPQFLSLSLLAPGSEIQVLTYPIEDEFNRIEISLGAGLLNALSTLEVYEIQRIMAKPQITTNQPDGKFSVCEGDPITLSVVNPISGNTYHWYTQASGGTAFLSGTTLTISSPSVGNYNYFIGRSKNGCLEESARANVQLVVLPYPGKPHLTITNVNN